MARDGALMASAFDPSRFIEAEIARGSQAGAGVASDFAWSATPPNPAENRRFLPPATSPLAIIATIAAPDEKLLPWGSDLRRFVDGDRPTFVTADLWDKLIEEAWDVHRQCGNSAIDAGWTMLDLFGCNPDPLMARVDRNGLVAAIVGLKTKVAVTGLDGRSAILQPQSGPPMRYYRSPAPGTALLWEAYTDPQPP